MLYSNINPERSYWMGADGFTWWVGQVQGDGAKRLNKDLSISDGPVDETRSNRVKVRIIGYHSSKWDELPVEDLPWAQVMMPAIFPQSSGMGSLHQLHLGTYVLGFFLDGLNCQQPIVMGVIGDIATGNLKKLKKGNLITDNPEQPGFNNTLSPLADNTNQSSQSNGWATPPSTVGPDLKYNGSFDFGFDITKVKGSYSSGDEKKVGGPSPADLKTAKDKEKEISLASPCGTETQEKIDQTLGDLFRFLKGIKKINDQYVNKYTGEVIDFVSKISGFVGRISTIVGDILGSIKTLIINKIKQLVRNLINDILNPIAESLIPAREFSDQLLNLIICLVDNILKSILQFIANIILALIENVINAAFCLVQGFINSILSAITSAISGALQAIQGIVSIIGQGGDLISNLASNLADFIGSLCGGLECKVDASRYDMKTGELQPRSLFGSSDAIINTDFLNNIDAPKIFDDQGNLVQGTLNCSESNLLDLACPPRIGLLGLNGDAGVPTILPVIDNIGRIISTIIQDPGINISTNPTAIVTSCNGYGNGAKLRPIIGFGTGGTAVVGVGGTTNLAAPTILLNVSPNSISSGGTSLLTWDAPNANKIESSNFGATTLAGSRVVSVNETTGYTLSVSGPGGTATASTTLEVGAGSTSPLGLPPTIYLSANPNPITVGQSTQLSWEILEADTIVSSNFEAKKLFGTITVNPQITTTYTITASGRGGITSSSLTLIVNPVGTGQVVDVIIDNPGVGYFNGGTAIPSDSPDYVGALIGFNVTNVGSGYDENTQVLVNGVNYGVPTISDTGNITSVNVPTTNIPPDGANVGFVGINVPTINGGFILDAFPTIEIVGNGSGANVVPIIKYVPIDRAQELAYKYNIPIENIDCPGHPQGN